MIYTYRLDLSYQGADFTGWQSQPSGDAVQDHLQSALKTVLGQKISVTGASRTDSGVHAEQQVASFRCERKFDLLRLPISLNALLPKSIAVLDAELMESEFHPIRSCQGKVYRYRFWQGRLVSPFVSPYVWQVQDGLDIERMRLALDSFTGEHDFSAFCASDSTAKTKIRHIFEAKLVVKGPLVELWISGEGFLKQMVRAIAGTLLQMGLGKIPGDFSPILASLDRSAAGPTAPAKGLALVQLFYESRCSLDEMIQWSSEGFAFGLPPRRS